MKTVVDDDLDRVVVEQEVRVGGLAPYAVGVAPIQQLQVSVDAVNQVSGRFFESAGDGGVIAPIEQRRCRVDGGGVRVGV
jgi:hypothetical protein